jgi:hypothetical protein
MNFFFLGLGIGLVLGLIFIWLIFRRLLAGHLRVDRSDPYDGPYLFLELHKSIEATTKNYVILKVKEEDFVPRK